MSTMITMKLPYWQNELCLQGFTHAIPREITPDPSYKLTSTVRFSKNHDVNNDMHGEPRRTVCLPEFADERLSEMTWESSYKLTELNNTFLDK